MDAPQTSNSSNVTPPPIVQPPIVQPPIVRPDIVPSESPPLATNRSFSIAWWGGLPLVLGMISLALAFALRVSDSRALMVGAATMLLLLLFALVVGGVVSLIFRRSRVPLNVVLAMVGLVAMLLGGLQISRGTAFQANRTALDNLSSNLEASRAQVLRELDEKGTIDARVATQRSLDTLAKAKQESTGESALFYQAMESAAKWLGEVNMPYLEAVDKAVPEGAIAIAEAKTLDELRGKRSTIANFNRDNAERTRRMRAMPSFVTQEVRKLGGSESTIREIERAYATGRASAQLANALEVATLDDAIWTDLEKCADILEKHWGAWRRTSDGVVEFDDAVVADEYTAIINRVNEAAASQVKLIREINAPRSDTLARPASKP